MSDRMKVEFKGFERISGGGDVVAFIGEGLVLAPAAEKVLGVDAQALVARVAEAERFKGKAKSTLVIAAPQNVPADRLILVGVGGADDRPKLDYAILGGVAMGKLTSGRNVSVIFSLPELAAEDGQGVAKNAASESELAADLSLGLRLRAYKFDRYKTKKGGEGDNATVPSKVTILVSDPSEAKKLAKAREAVAGGVIIARDLINEPPNVLYPEEFADRASQLDKLGVEIEVLNDKQLKKLGMHALLGVSQGSEREARVVVMRWNGGGEGAKPIAFIGKGVVFDSGGISIKPAAGMEDMKGDMGGAACVVGLMHALASRKAKVNVIGAIGIVENMPDGNAQRPGDIVTSMSGQTIEIINTDAEGRLVLADVLWYVKDRYDPKLMIDLATLTGAIIVSLGHEHAGLFSNDDSLAERLRLAGEATGETVWRMPLGKAYDKMIDSKFADMKNTGGRYGGSITAAQFLQRFVGTTPWAHLDIAGTGMGAPNTEICQSWAPGWGVRLLDRLVGDNYEG